MAPGPPTIYTIGHSNRTLEEFLGLLATHGIGAIADIRRWPTSRHVPWAAGDLLRAELAARGIAYRHVPALGGYRRPFARSPNTGWRTPGFRGYADHMATEEFRSGLAEVTALARERPTALMCAEATPWRCHRSLVADALHVAGWRVLHVVGASEAQAHRPTPFLVVAGERLLYPAGV